MLHKVLTSWATVNFTTWTLLCKAS